MKAIKLDDKLTDLLKLQGAPDSTIRLVETYYEDVIKEITADLTKEEKKIETKRTQRPETLNIGELAKKARLIK